MSLLRKGQLYAASLVSFQSGSLLQERPKERARSRKRRGTSLLLQRRVTKNGVLGVSGLFSEKQSLDERAAARQLSQRLSGAEKRYLEFLSGRLLDHWPWAYFLKEESVKKEIAWMKVAAVFEIFDLYGDEAGIITPFSFLHLFIASKNSLSIADQEQEKEHRHISEAKITLAFKVFEKMSFQSECITNTDLINEYAVEIKQSVKTDADKNEGRRTLPGVNLFEFIAFDGMMSGLHKFRIANSELAETNTTYSRFFDMFAIERGIGPGGEGESRKVFTADSFCVALRAVLMCYGVDAFDHLLALPGDTTGDTELVGLKASEDDNPIAKTRKAKARDKVMKRYQPAHSASRLTLISDEIFRSFSLDDEEDETHAADSITLFEFVDFLRLEEETFQSYEVFQKSNQESGSFVDDAIRIFKQYGHTCSRLSFSGLVADLNLLCHILPPYLESRIYGRLRAVFEALPVSSTGGKERVVEKEMFLTWLMINPEREWKSCVDRFMFLLRYVSLKVHEPQPGQQESIASFFSGLMTRIANNQLKREDMKQQIRAQMTEMVALTQELQTLKEAVNTQGVGDHDLSEYNSDHQEFPWSKQKQDLVNATVRKPRVRTLLGNIINRKLLESSMHGSERSQYPRLAFLQTVLSRSPIVSEAVRK